MSRVSILASVQLPPRSAYSRLTVQARLRNGRRYVYLFREIQRTDDVEWKMFRCVSVDLDEVEPLLEALRQAAATAGSER